MSGSQRDDLIILCKGGLVPVSRHGKVMKRNTGWSVWVPLLSPNVDTVEISI